MTEGVRRPTIVAEPAGAVLDIDLGAIAANWRTLSARHERGAVAGVVKADAYGLGADMVAPALYAAGCRHFFIALLDEALAIRALVPDAMVAVLNGLFPGTEGEYIANRIVPVLGSRTELDAWDAAAERAGRALPAIVHIDTGMARLGLTPDELEVPVPDGCPGALRDDAPGVRGVAGGPAATWNRRPASPRAARGFRACREASPTPPASSCAASSSELARPGAALYGINPTPGRANPMRPVVRLRGAGAGGARRGDGRERRLQRDLARRPAVAHRDRRHRLRGRLDAQPIEPRGGGF